MFKKIIIVVSIIAAMAIGARYVQASKNVASAPVTTSLSEINQLALGALRLEDTDQAVTADQATDLLTLWKAYRSLSDANAATAAELQALTRQIGEGLTDEQLAAIDAMALTPADAAAYVQEHNLEASVGVGDLDHQRDRRPGRHARRRGRDDGRRGRHGGRRRDDGRGADGHGGRGRAERRARRRPE
jgi:hypothetical protein